MPYIGRSPEYGGLEKQLITANGSDGTFALNYVVGSESSILVSVAGVLQQPGTAYNISGGGANIVFTSAPLSGSDVFIIFLGRAYDSQNIATGVVTGQTALGTSPAAADVFLMYDDSASALKKVAYSDLESDSAAMPANTVKVRDANSTGTPTNKVVADTQLLIGDGTGFTAATLSGHATLANTGAVTLATATFTGQSAITDVADADVILVYDDSASAFKKVTKANFGGGIKYSEKTSAFTAVKGEGYLINTGSAVTATLPASPTIGDEVRLIDATGGAASNNITVARNSEKIQGSAANLTIATARAAIGLVYYNSTHGWVLTEN
jgi:hypothetical protein